MKKCLKLIKMYKHVTANSVKHLQKRLIKVLRPLNTKWVILEMLFPANLLVSTEKNLQKRIN